LDARTDGPSVVCLESESLAIGRQKAWQGEVSLGLYHVQFSKSRGTRVVFRVHAVQRMYERAISTAEVCDVLADGATIEDYPADQPYPSRLVLGWCRARPIHVVVADNEAENEMIVITVYEPDQVQWVREFRRRRQ
jgi:hypothetical protein